MSISVHILLTNRLPAPVLTLNADLVKPCAALSLSPFLFTLPPFLLPPFLTSHSLAPLPSSLTCLSSFLTLLPSPLSHTLTSLLPVSLFFLSHLILLYFLSPSLPPFSCSLSPPSISSFTLFFFPFCHSMLVFSIHSISSLSCCPLLIPSLSSRSYSPHFLPSIPSRSTPPFLYHSPRCSHSLSIYSIAIHFLLYPSSFHLIFSFTERSLTPSLFVVWFIRSSLLPSVLQFPLHFLW